jgi:triacylglycerol lipase
VVHIHRLVASQLPSIDDVDDGDVAGRRDTPVLLVHGYGANKSNWFFLTRHLRAAGFTRIHTYNYNPLVADVPTLAQRCVDEAEALKAHVGVDRIHIVGHSLGGLIARYAIQVLGLEGVDVCATVASPHNGVDSARFAALMPELALWRCARDLHPGSSVLHRLHRAGQPVATRFVSYHATLDMVVPARRAMIFDEGIDAENIAIADHGHLSVMLSRRLGRSIVEQFERAEADRPAEKRRRRSRGAMPLAG